LIAIRRAGPDDAAAAASLFAQYLAFYERDPSPGSVGAFLTERLKNEDSIIFLAFNGDEAVGMTQVYPTFSSLALARAWILNDLFVTPAARGTGVGRALLRRVCGEAEQAGCAYVTLETSGDNVTAQGLYETEGFEREESWHYARSSTR
jgi:GNAT superfamily N-acetyltransferase